MRRYTEDELRRLKEETDLAQLVRAAGVELRSVGQDLRGRCPFHDDDGPSLVVTPSKQLWQPPFRDSRSPGPDPSGRQFLKSAF